MYSLQILAPFIVAMCAEGFTTGQGDVCVLDNNKPNMVYYEAGKSCYVNGTFYPRCEERQ